MGDKYSPGRKHSGIWNSLRDGDFDEEEIWDVIKNRSDYGSSGVRMFNEKDQSSAVPVPARPSAARMVPRSSNSSNNSSGNSSNEAKVLQQSAPVKIPDWSKIYTSNPAKNSTSRFDADYDGEDDGAGNYGGDSDEDGEENDEADSKLPPHEFIARRLARSQISSFSVLEGAGRTLKGRDLSKVRNAVLSKTGFLESL